MRPNAYIKNRKKFQTIHYQTPISYEAPVGSNEKDTGQFVFADDPNHTFLTITDPYWLCYKQYVFKIVSVESAEGLVTVTVEPPIATFSRMNIDFSFRFSTMGGFIAGLIQQNYVKDIHYWPDEEYEMPYLTVINEDDSEPLTPEYSTEFLVPYNYLRPGKKMMPSGLFDTYEYLLTANQNKTMFNFTFDDDRLYLTIKTKPEIPYVLINNDGHTKMVSFNYDKEVISKLRVFVVSRDDNGNAYIENPYQYPNEPSTPAEYTYYLLKSGKIIQNNHYAPPASNRVIGKWETRTISAATQNQLELDPPITNYKLATEEAHKVFAQNIDKINIEFYSDIDLEWGRPVKMIINDVAWTGIISKKIISSEDDRFFYTIGEMKTTVTQKLLSLL